MMTWMTRTSYGRTAEDLDNVQLNRCMTDTVVIFDVLTGAARGPRVRHPAMRMWNGYEFALGVYAMMLCLEWSGQRGFTGHQSFWYLSRAINQMKGDDPDFVYEAPPWREDKDVLASHRSNLLRRYPQTYDGKWEVCPENWPYIWPVIDFNHPDGYKLLITKQEKERLKNGERVLPAKQKARIANWRA